MKRIKPKEEKNIDYNGPVPAFCHVQFANDKENNGNHQLADIIIEANAIEKLKYLLKRDYKNFKYNLETSEGVMKHYYEGKLAYISELSAQLGLEVIKIDL